MQPPGLQRERTTLAWIRTGISAGALGVLLLRDAIKTGSGLAIAAAVTGLVAAVAIMGLGRRNVQGAQSAVGSSHSIPHGAVLAVTGTVLAVGLLIEAETLMG